MRLTSYEAFGSALLDSYLPGLIAAPLWALSIYSTKFTRSMTSSSRLTSEEQVYFDSAITLIFEEAETSFHLFSCLIGLNSRLQFDTLCLESGAVLPLLALLSLTELDRVELIEEIPRLNDAATKLDQLLLAHPCHASSTELQLADPVLLFHNSRAPEEFLKKCKKYRVMAMGTIASCVLDGIPPTFEKASQSSNTSGLSFLVVLRLCCCFSSLSLSLSLFPSFFLVHNVILNQALLASLRSALSMAYDDTDCANDLYSLVFGIRPGQAHKLTDFVKGMLLLFPLRILEEMLASAQGGLDLFDNDSFSPLLIWDGHSRASFASIIRRSAAKAAGAHMGEDEDGGGIMWPAKNMLPSAKLPPFLVPRKDLSSTGKILFAASLLLLCVF